MRRALTTWRSWPVRRQVLVLNAALLVAVGAALAGYFALKRPGDVSNPGAEFRAEAKERERPKRKVVDWPLFGYDAERTKYLPAGQVEPPFRKRWSWDSGELIEFSPIAVDGRIYGMNNDSLLFALDAGSGKLLWKRRIGELSAGTPAYDHGRLYGVTLAPGLAFAVRARDGKLLWRHPLPGRSESSPVVHHGRVIFGCECNSVIALSARDGDPAWSTPTAGAVKAAVAISKGTAYVGDYAGEMYALNAGDGSVEWQSSDQGSSFGRSGRFYSTPAVAFGRVYAGSVDGRVYSYEVSGGGLAWSQSTGNWVYGGVVAADPKGAPPTVLAGSFDQHAYAFNARSGAVRWVADVGGIVSGAGSAIGDVYYVSNLGGRTFGLDVRNGKRVFEFDRGQYNPAISDGRRLYITGYSSITALDPREKRKGARRAKDGRGSRRNEGAPSHRERGGSRSGRSTRTGPRRRRRP